MGGSSVQGKDTSTHHLHPVICLAVLAATFGMGMGTTLLLTQWNQSRLRAWNRTAITARAVRVYVSDDLVLSTQYALRNNTSRDFRITLRDYETGPAAAWKVMMRDFRGLTPVGGKGTRIDADAVEPTSLLLPADEEAGITVKTLCLARKGDSKEEVEKSLPKEFRGFVIFDYENRLQIEMPFTSSAIE
jgi:hypothetical protein